MLLKSSLIPFLMVPVDTASKVLKNLLFYILQLNWSLQVLIEKLKNKYFFNFLNLPVDYGSYTLPLIQLNTQFRLLFLC